MGRTIFGGLSTACFRPFSPALVDSFLTSILLPILGGAAADFLLFGLLKTTGSRTPVYPMAVALAFGRRGNFHALCCREDG
jgi:hypothetical protein